MRIWSITTASAAWHACTTLAAHRFSIAIRSAEVFGGRSSLISSASSDPSAPGCTTLTAVKAAPVSASRSAISSVVTTPSEFLLTNSASITRIVPLSTRSPRRNSLGRCRRVGWCGRDGVVPFAVEVVAGDGEGVDLLFRVLDAGGVGAGVELRADGQPGRGAGGADQVDDDLVAGQRPTPPVQGDLGEQPVFDLVPF